MQARWLLRTAWGLTGLGLTAGLFLGFLLLVVAVDLAAPMGVAMRCLALGLVVLPAAVAFVLGVVAPSLRRLRAGEVARRIESHIPGMHNRLVSCMDLESKKDRVAPAFYRRLVQEALARVRGFRATRVIDARRLRQALLLAAGCGLLFAAAYFALPERVQTALARVFRPLADIPPASSVQFTVAPGDAKLLRGEDLAFRVDVTRGEPEDLRLEMTPLAGGKPRRHKLEPQSEGKVFALGLHSTNLGDGFDSGFTYRVVGGGTWSVKHTIQMLERPSITAAHRPALPRIHGHRRAARRPAADRRCDRAGRQSR